MKATVRQAGIIGGIFVLALGTFAACHAKPIAAPDQELSQVDEEDFWANCPPPSAKKTLLAMKVEPTADQDGVDVVFNPVSAYGDVVSVRHLNTMTPSGGGQGASTAVFITCDTKTKKELMLDDLVPIAAVSKALESASAKAFLEAKNYVKSFGNFALTGLDEGKNTLHLLLGHSGPKGVLQALRLDVMLTPEQTAGLRKRLAGPIPKSQPFESKHGDLYEYVTDIE